MTGDHEDHRVFAGDLSAVSQQNLVPQKADPAFDEEAHQKEGEERAGTNGEEDLDLGAALDGRKRRKRRGRGGEEGADEQKKVMRRGSESSMHTEGKAPPCEEGELDSELVGFDADEGTDEEDWHCYAPW